MRTTLLRFLVVGTAFGLLACGMSGSGATSGAIDPAASGGVPTTGSGGANAAGGVSSVTSSSAPSGAGGATISITTAAGGSLGMGGAAGSSSLGSGGSLGMGGRASSGGAMSAGGAVGMGGAMSLGGNSSMGGSSSASMDAGAPRADAGALSPDTGAATDTLVPADSGDKFTPVGTNPFVMTAYDPFSTFAADVDTASYDIFRRDAAQGLLPAASSVRLEEYVNYFSYDYPAPIEGSPYPFQISLAAANQVFDRGTALLRVGIQAMQQPAFVKKATNLVFLLDVSGSMADANKLPLVQKLILATLDQLDASDHVSIVTYSTTAKVVLGTTSMEMKDQVAAVVAGLSASGSTAGADGIGLAYSQAEAGFFPGGINHIVMCTDGDFNVGPSSTAELLDLIRSKRSTGVTLTVLGFGSGNLNDAMMEAVSDAGNGIYSVIIDEASARDYAANKILATINHVAKDMKIQVEFNPDKVVAYRLLGYEDRAIADQDFRNDATDAGEVGAGHRVTALYEMVLTGGTVPVPAGAPLPETGEPSTLPREVGQNDFVLVKVRYKPVDATDATPATEIAGSLPSVLLAQSLGEADADMQWAVAVAALAEMLKISPYADRSFLPVIQAIATQQAGRDPYRAEFAGLLANIAGKL
jgi:Ca-activated chloride channel family protein